MREWNNRLGNPPTPGDYTDPETGLLVCGVCGEPKQMRVELLGMAQTVPCDCRCIQEEKSRQREEQARRDAEYRAAKRRTECFRDDMRKAGCTFDSDDQKNAKLARQVRGYVRQFEKFRQEGRGLLFLGPTGTGKTFYACCIANALIDAGYSAIVTNFAQIANDLQGTFDKAQVHNRLLRADLLVLDDLAAERDTSFMQEIVFQVVEERSAAKKPLIVTSNVSTQEFMNPGDLARRRVFSRLKEVCIPIAVTGADRREEQMRKRVAGDQALLDAAGAVTSGGKAL
ncbi:ATP-binding protein [uncultured Subdoligranulum sp.]|uniref:ATP-binding protein n=1 Tax=uncultured Subdoligranulum sp. TaxID=512298 RepID=UPI00262C813D|nr:ATP-binding protein [uncultured Subdoligranulum sp.]